MSTPFIGSLMSCAFNFAPRNFTQCNGQLLPINSNQALFSLIGTTFGGDGRTTFALPNLQDRTPISSGQGAGLSGYTLGQRGGEVTHTLLISEIPAHPHQVNASSATGGTPRLAGNSPGVSPSGVTLYGAPQSLATMAPAVVSQTGNNQAHENRQPFLVINWVIALNGIFPPRN